MTKSENLPKAVLPPARLRRRRISYLRGMLLVAVAAVPMATAALLLLTRLSPWPPPHGQHQLPPLPAYGLELSDCFEARFPRTDTLKLKTSSLLGITARPAEAVIGPVAISVFLRHAGMTKQWAVHFEELGTGTFFLRRIVSELPGLAAGGWSLTLFVARPWAMPAQPDEALRRAPGDDVRVLHGTLEIEPAAP